MRTFLLAVAVVAMLSGLSMASFDWLARDSAEGYSPRPAVHVETDAG